MPNLLKKMVEIQADVWQLQKNIQSFTNSSLSYKMDQKT